MEIKDYVTVTLSVLAFGLGLFNLWWGTFRRRIALFFVQTSSWRYALVNGGKTDILVTEVRYWFRGDNPVSSTMPAQSTGVDEGHPVLIKAGTALEHSVVFNEPDFRSLFRPGTPPGEESARQCTVWAEISWVDNNGHSQYATVDTAEVVVLPTRIGAWRALTHRVDLSPPRIPRPGRSRLAAMFNLRSSTTR